MKLKEFIPPILISFFGKTQQNPTVERFYSSCSAALLECNGGYEEPQLIKTVYEKTRIYRDILASQKPRVIDLSSLRTLVGLSLAVTDRD